MRASRVREATGLRAPYATHGLRLEFASLLVCAGVLQELMQNAVQARILSANGEFVAQ